jgi:hypothetical protein
MDDLELAARARREAGGAKKLAILLSSRGHQNHAAGHLAMEENSSGEGPPNLELTGIALHDLRRTSGRAGMPV